MITKERIIRIGILFSLVNLVLTTTIGVLLRYHKVIPFRWLNERFWIHAHSHTGFLGWMFIAFAITAFSIQMPDKPSLNKRVFLVVLGLQLSVIGMLATFPFTGYALFSILFSTVHMVLSAIFIFQYFKNTSSQLLGVRLMRVAMVFFLISGIGPIALGPMMAAGLKDTSLYDMAVYFYLHFQYNGWFVFAILSFIFNHIENTVFTRNHDGLLAASKALLISVFLTYSLSVYGITTHGVVVFLGISGATIQFIATTFLTFLIITNQRQHFLHTIWTKWLFILALTSWNIKNALQLFSAIPQFSTFIYTNRDMIILYLHLMFLGVATCYLFGLWIHNNRLDIRKPITKAGIILLLFGILSTELFIGLRSLPQYLTYESFLIVNHSLLVASGVLLVGVLLILSGYYYQLSLRLKQYP